MVGRSDSDYTGASFYGSTITGSTFKNSVLVDGNFRGCKIDGADFQNVNFTGDDFAGATIRSLPEKKLAMTELNLLTKTCLIVYDLCRRGGVLEDRF